MAAKEIENIPSGPDAANNRLQESGDPALLGSAGVPAQVPPQTMLVEAKIVALPETAAAVKVPEIQPAAQDNAQPVSAGDQQHASVQVEAPVAKGMGMAAVIEKEALWSLVPEGDSPVSASEAAAAGPRDVPVVVSVVSSKTDIPQDQAKGSRAATVEENARGIAAAMEPLLRLARKAGEDAEAAPRKTPPQASITVFPEVPQDEKPASAQSVAKNSAAAQQANQAVQAGSGNAQQGAGPVPSIEKTAELPPAAKKQGGAPAQDRKGPAVSPSRGEVDKSESPAAETAGSRVSPDAVDTAPQLKPEPEAALPAASETAGTAPAASAPAHLPAPPAAESVAHSRPAPAAPVLAEDLPKPGEAKLAQQAGSAEMRVAFETEKLGAVELRARVSGDQVGAAIVVERHDAHAVLAAELPALRQSLEDRQLRIEQMTLQQGSVGGGHGQGGAYAQAQGEGQGSARLAAAAWRLAAVVPRAGEWMIENGRMFDSQGRLSVRA